MLPRPGGRPGQTDARTIARWGNRVNEGSATSGRLLHGLQEAQHSCDVFLLEDLLPRRHALGASTLRDRLVEHRRHALAVADAQASQITRGLGTVGVRRVAV